MYAKPINDLSARELRTLLYANNYGLDADLLQKAADVLVQDDITGAIFLEMTGQDFQSMGLSFGCRKMLEKFRGMATSQVGGEGAPPQEYGNSAVAPPPPQGYGNTAVAPPPPAYDTPKGRYQETRNYQQPASNNAYALPGNQVAVELTDNDNRAQADNITYFDPTLQAPVAPVQEPGDWDKRFRYFIYLWLAVAGGCAFFCSIGLMVDSDMKEIPEMEYGFNLVCVNTGLLYIVTGIFYYLFFTDYTPIAWKCQARILIGGTTFITNCMLCNYYMNIEWPQEWILENWFSTVLAAISVTVHAFILFIVAMVILGLFCFVERNQTAQA